MCVRFREHVFRKSKNTLNAHRVTASYELDSRGKDRYLSWRNPETVRPFFYTWNMVLDHFET